MRNRVIISVLAAAALGLFTAFVFGAGDSALSVPAGATSPSAAGVIETLPGRGNQPVNEVLDKTLVNVSRGTPLQQAFAEIAAAAKIRMTVDWDCIETAGVPRNGRVDVELGEVSARTALHAILARRGSVARLAMVVDDNQLIISTRDDLRFRYQFVHTYDIGGLVADFAPGSREGLAADKEIVDTISAAVEPESWRDNGGGIGVAKIVNNVLVINQSYDVLPRVDDLVAELINHSGRVTTAYDVRDLLKDAPAADPHTTGKVDELINAIETTCGRDTWRDKGGTTSSIAAFDGKLYVTTTPAVQRQITELLAMMRK